MILRPVALALLAVLAPAPALAAPHGGAAFIADYDSDHDGRVTRAEYDAVRHARFRATDTSGDGWLSEAEYVGEYQARLETQLATSDLPDDKKLEERQRQTRQAHVRFGVLDKDEDGRMQQAEYDASGARAYAEHDGDADGIVTAADAARTDAPRTASATPG